MAEATASGRWLAFLAAVAALREPPSACALARRRVWQAPTMNCTLAKWVRPVLRVFMPSGMNHVRWACASAPRALSQTAPGRAALSAPTAARRNTQKVQQPVCERQMPSLRKLSKEGF
eukprot:6738641-Alexandrium_andersonii.AAC.1